jgi:hypothetical protein
VKTLNTKAKFSIPLIYLSQFWFAGHIANYSE